jgi:hypothetical protein
VRRLPCAGGDGTVSSGGPAGDAEGLPHARSGAPAGENSGARERVKSGAAWVLHCRATADSAVDDHAGFVPDACLAGLGTGTAALAAELCSAGLWSGLRVATGSWTGTRSAGARTSHASCPARRRGSAPGSGPGTGGRMTSEYHPDPDPQVENARRAWLEIRATARHQLQAMGGVPETGTEAGERYRLLQWNTTHAYIRYLDTRTAAYPPRPTRRQMPARPSTTSSTTSTPPTATPPSGTPTAPTARLMRRCLRPVQGTAVTYC